MSGDGKITGPADGYEEGTWNCICQRCGVKFKNYDVTKEWTGLIVCKKKCFEVRHPQDFVRGVKDDQSLPFTSPEQANVYISPTYVGGSTGTQENTIPSGNNNNTI